MPRRVSLITSLLIALAACSSPGPKISTGDAWARETGTADSTAAYVTVDNKGAADRLTYTWTVTEIATGSTIATLDGATVSYTPPGGGAYAVQLRVTDGDGGVARDRRGSRSHPHAGHVKCSHVCDRRGHGHIQCVSHRCR